jgi:hypothetical protein
MKVNIWKMSHGTNSIKYEEFLKAIERREIILHPNTRSIGKSKISQAELFRRANNGDYIYLTRGNKGIILLGKIISKVKIIRTGRLSGWIFRKYRIIQYSKKENKYRGKVKQWSPNYDSTFIKIPREEYELFESELLLPYFGVKMSDM